MPFGDTANALSFPPGEYDRVIGCVVNGPGEALYTDVGFTGGGKDSGMIYIADEARAIHYGDKEEREIYGETSIDDAVELIEEGINVEPLPGINPKLKN